MGIHSVFFPREGVLLGSHRRMPTLWMRSVSIGAAGALVLYVVSRKVQALWLEQAESTAASSTGDGKPRLLVAEEAEQLEEGVRRPLTKQEVQRHCTTDDCWIIIDGAVYDVTEFALSHPGGPELVYQCAGRDATVDFLSVHPPEYAWEYVGPAIGVIETRVPKDMPPAGLPPSLEEGTSGCKCIFRCDVETQKYEC